jgi:hypothetical protein
MHSFKNKTKRQPDRRNVEVGTPEFASQLIGKREIIRQQSSLSRPTRWGGGMRHTWAVSEQHVVEDAAVVRRVLRPLQHGPLSTAGHAE